MDCTEEIKLILEGHNENGGKFWSREDGDIHAPNGRSTIDTLNVLGEVGATAIEYPLLEEAVEFVFGHQAPDGSFKYAMKSPRLPCITARILCALGRLGVQNDARVERGYQQLLLTQWFDGGWRCNTVKLRKSHLTDASNPGTTLYALDAFRFRENDQKELEKLNEGVDLLLQHWDIRRPVGPCNFGMGTRFFKVEYPFLRYNLFYYVYVLSFYEKARQDCRFHMALEALSAKTKIGTVIPENPHRAWRKYDFARVGRISEQATMRWKEINMNLTKINVRA